MPVSCAACKNRYIVGSNIHFFRFPISNNELMTKWLSAIRRKNFEPTKWSRLCSVHFTEQDFQVRPGAYHLLLKENAVPSIFPSHPSYLQKPNKIPRKPPTLRNTFSKDVTVDQLENNIVHQCDNMHSISNFKSVEVQTETSHSNEEMHKNKTVDQLENNIVHQCDNMHSISNFKSVEVQTETSHSNEEMHKNKTVDQLENNIVHQCDNMHSISNFKSVEVQTETSHSNEKMHKNKIKILQQKLRRKNKKIDLLEDLVKVLKNIEHSKLPNKKQDTQSLHLDDVQIEFEETNDNCKSDNTNLNLVSNCNDFEETIKQFDGCVGKMKHAFDSDKAYFQPAIKSFVKSLENNVKTYAGLYSAMENFCKYSELNPEFKNSKLMSNKRIGTQPTANTRQKTQIRKRNNLTARSTPVPEHGYAIRLGSSKLPKKKHNTPHSLTSCVIEIN